MSNGNQSMSMVNGTGMAWAHHHSNFHPMKIQIKPAMSNSKTGQVKRNGNGQ